MGCHRRSIFRLPENVEHGCLFVGECDGLNSRFRYPGQAPRGIDVVGTQDVYRIDQIAPVDMCLRPEFTNATGPSAPLRRYKEDNLLHRTPDQVGQGRVILLMGVEFRSSCRKSLTRFAPKMRNTEVSQSDVISGPMGSLINFGVESRWLMTWVLFPNARRIASACPFALE